MRAAAVLALAVLASTAPATAGPTTSTYTDVASCRSVDMQEDEFAHFCRGPAGMAAVLYYFDGRAFPTFGPAAKGKRDEVREGAGGDLEPLDVGATGAPFGGKIEWVSVGGAAPCAVIVRMSLEAGSRLVVTSIGEAPERVAVVKGNREAAQAAAAKACGSAGGGQRAEAASPSGKAAPLAYKEVGLDHPVARKLWFYAYDDIEAAGMEPQVYNASFKRGADEYIVSQMSRGPNCGMRSCDTKLVKNGQVVELGLLCNAIDHHVLAADKRTITFCDEDVRIR